jgi:hypothetical protein
MMKHLGWTYDADEKPVPLAGDEYMRQDGDI